MKNLINVNGTDNGNFVSCITILERIMKDKNFIKVVDALPAKNMSIGAQHKVIVVDEKFTADDDLTIEFYADKSGQANVDFYVGEKDATNLLITVNHPALKRSMVTNDIRANDVAGAVITYLVNQGLVSVN